MRVEIEAQALEIIQDRRDSLHKSCPLCIEQQTKGYLGDPSWSPGRSGQRWQDVSSAGIGQPEPLTDAKYESRFHLAIRDFLDAIREDRDPLEGPEPARDVVEMIVAVFESHRQGGPVALPLENRRHPLTMLES